MEPLFPLLKEISRIFLGPDPRTIYTELLHRLLKEIRGTHGMISTVDARQTMHCYTLALDEGTAGENSQELSLEYSMWKNLWPGIEETAKVQIKNRDKAGEAAAGRAENSILAPLHYQENFLGIIEIQGVEKPYSTRDAEELELVLEYITPIQHAWRERQNQEEEQARTHRALRESERKYKSIFENSPDLIYMTDADGRILTINPAGARMLGLQEPAEALGEQINQYYYEPQERPYYVEKISWGHPVQNHEIILTRRGKEDPLFGLEDVVLVPAEENQPAFYQSIVKDITDRVRSEQEVMKKSMELSEANSRMREYQDRLEKKNRLLQEANTKIQNTQDQLVQQEKMASIGQLAAGIAHEINNPMGFVKSNYATLKKYFASLQRFLQEFQGVCIQGSPAPGEVPAIQKRLRQIFDEEDIPFLLDDTADLFEETESGFDRIMAIVANMKDFSRIDQGAKQNYRLNEALESTLIIAKNEYKYYASIEKELGEVPPFPCSGNEINQVLLNLIVNAAQALKEAGKSAADGIVRLETRTEGPWAVCRISDNGPGIPEDIRDSVFNPFFTTKAPGEGTGLGLSISYNIIVNQHHGKLTVESTPGEGTAFEIRLPLEPKEKTDE